MIKDNKIRIFVVTAFIVVGVLLCIIAAQFSSHKKNLVLPPNNDKIHQQKIDSLNALNSLFISQIDSLNSQNIALNNRKPEIKIKYKKTYEKIDGSNANDIVGNFKSVFTANNIE